MIMLLALAATLLLATAAAADAPISFAPEKIVWTDGPPTLPAGSKIAVLEGNPQDEGLFTMRVRVPAGTALAPHWHPRDERVTILSGAVELGFGSVADREAVTRYGPGSFYVNPPRVMHYLFFSEATEMQMTGLGPWEIHKTDISAPADVPTTGTIVLRSVDPPTGSELANPKEITAVVDYEVHNFRPATFFLTMQFESQTPNQSFSSSVVIRPAEVGAPYAPPRANTLTAARGSFTVKQELEPILRNARLRRPVRMRIFLHELTSESRSEVVATTDWVEYR